MTQAELRAELTATSPENVVRMILERPTIAVFPTAPAYAQFRQRVAAYFAADEIFVMGSGNLGYSLNPFKRGLLFRRDSDVDTVLISETLFAYYWNELRIYHRANYYRLDSETQRALLRSGQDVYSGFVSPKFIPERIYPLRRDFDLTMDRLSDDLVGYREVRAYIFRNRTEVYDYYKRGLLRFK